MINRKCAIDSSWRPTNKEVYHMILETFSNWVAEFSAVLGICMIVISVIYTCLKVATRNKE